MPSNLTGVDVHSWDKEEGISSYISKILDLDIIFHGFCKINKYQLRLAVKIGDSMSAVGGFLCLKTVCQGT